jgi:3-methyladenine DNA glycosylase AlkD
MIISLQQELKNLEDKEKAMFLTRFFKTGKGEYAEGDVFYGITVPVSRKIAIKYKDLPLDEIKDLLRSKIHEERLIAVFILVLQFQKAEERKRKEIYTLYLSYTKYINNWDIVDSSADKIIGEYLWQLQSPDNTKEVLYKLAKADNLWDRRIAIMSTYAFIKHGNASLTFTVADVLLKDKHDLIHKAVGWMLREVGKRISSNVEEAFLKSKYKTMPRTMLRYAIEHFTVERRKAYLSGKV